MVILYSTGCPKCRILEKKLDEKKIKYEVVTNRDVMIDKGFSSAPKLEIDGEILDFSDGMRWILNKEVQ